MKHNGWTTAIEEAGIATSGMSESFLHVSNIAKTRRVHQITACALFKLMKAAYEDDMEEEDLNFDDWCSKKCGEQPSFMYWFMVLELELSLLTFIRSFREGNFDAYRKSIEKLMPYFFANDNIHYSRWLTIHLHDMITLSDCHPDVYEEFQRGHFALHKSQRAFSGMALDQVHEQNNAVVKSDGGAIGITENPSALLRWMTAGPEVCQLVTDYEEKSKGQDKEQILHHEDIPSAQKRFHNEVLNLSASIEELGNPFLEESGEFLTLDSKIISRSQNLYSFKAKGDDQFRSFRTCQHNFYDPIKKNKILLFENGTTQRTHTHTLKEKNVKQDRALFCMHIHTVLSCTFSAISG